jgi:hypothetical protein
MVEQSCVIDRHLYIRSILMHTIASSDSIKELNKNVEDVGLYIDEKKYREQLFNFYIKELNIADNTLLEYYSFLITNIKKTNTDSKTVLEAKDIFKSFTQNNTEKIITLLFNSLESNKF